MNAARTGVQRKKYLGDAVYARVDDFGRVVLTTEDGYRETNKIILEPEVLSALLKFIGGSR